MAELILLFTIASLIGYALGGILRNKASLIATIAFVIIFILFLPKSVISFTTRIAMSFGGNSWILQMILIILIAGFIFASAVKLIIKCIENIGTLSSKIVLVINVIVALAYLLWISDYIGLMLGTINVPSVYNIAVYGIMLIVSLVFMNYQIFGDEKNDNTLSNNESLINKFGSSINKKEDISKADIERYYNNSSMLDEHLQLGLISLEKYQKLTLELMLYTPEEVKDESKKEEEEEDTLKEESKKEEGKIYE